MYFTDILNYYGKIRDLYMQEEMTYCQTCINPIDSEINGRSECGICEQTFKELPDHSHFEHEREDFLANSQKLLYAYSGGMDSTVVLFKLADECKRREINLKLFTVDTGVKGKVAAENIRNIVAYLGLEENHRVIDISNKLQSSQAVLGVTMEPVSTLNVYAQCRDKNILPCGKICNSIIDTQYGAIMETEGAHVLVTGGDTPKRDSNGKYSLFWKKPSGITIFRGGYAFALTKQGNHDFISKNGIPWIDPNCGGYDTDCLVPGMFFADSFKHQPDQDPKNVIRRFPIILEYLSERTRFGVISRGDAIRKLGHVDIASSETYSEMENIFNTINQRKDV